MDDDKVLTLFWSPVYLFSKLAAGYNVKSYCSLLCIGPFPCKAITSVSWKAGKLYVKCAQYISVIAI